MTNKKFNELINLKDNWDTYGAEKPNNWSVKTALLATKFLPKSLEDYNVAPSVEGGVGIYWRRGDKYADIEFFNNQTAVAATTSRKFNNFWEVESWNNTIKEIDEFLEYEF